MRRVMRITRTRVRLNNIETLIFVYLVAFCTYLSKIKKGKVFRNIILERKFRDAFTQESDEI